MPERYASKPSRHSRSSSGDGMKVMFHPLREDVLFLGCTLKASSETDNKDGQGLAIIKYTFEKAWIARKIQFIKPSRQLDPNPCWLYKWYWEMCRPPVVINHYGMHAIFQGQSKGSDPVPCLLCYNVLTESFHQRFYQYPESIRSCYEDWDVKPHFNTSDFCDSHMTSVVVEDDESCEDFQTYVFRHINLDLFPMTSTTKDHEVLELNKPGVDPAFMTVLFDDKYMIVVRIIGYVVWSFQEGVFLPSAS
jgi:hypothetical protein